MLEKYEPRNVLYYFEKLAAIPHGSKNTAKISDAIRAFAESHKLPVLQDKLGNVIIRKEGTKGLEKAPGLILQGHMDMVTEKEADCTIDMDKQGLTLRVGQRKEFSELMGKTPGPGVENAPEDPILTAEGTTLGGDDGIAVAYMLAILAADDIPHPPLECVFTVDEEIGLIGASGLDTSVLTGKYLINIDSEEEGYLLVGCAGGCTATVRLPVKREKADDEGHPYVRIRVLGLRGGHSGMEIDKGRANADMLLGRLLQELWDAFSKDFRLCHVEGGSKDNAIPRSATACLLIPAGKEEELEGFLSERNQVYLAEYGAQEPGIRISVETLQKETGKEAEQDDRSETMLPMTLESTRKVILLLRMLPNGIQKMSFVFPGHVETSLNLGILKTEHGEVSASFSARSGVNSEKYEMVGRIRAVAKALGARLYLEGEYPAWEPKENSRLQKVMKQCYLEQYGREMIVETTHGGLECGLFADAIPGLDVVSIGPDMWDVHTPKETLDLGSAERTWKLLLRVMEELGK